MRLRMHITTLAFGMLLTVFGHDAMMAADPHIREHAVHETSSTSVPMTSTCGPTHGARPDTDNDATPDDSAGNPVVPQITETSGIHLLRWWTEPAHPPDVRRALLQVYLN
jgi:hypothetical protein